MQRMTQLSQNLTASSFEVADHRLGFASAPNGALAIANAPETIRSLPLHEYLCPMHTQGL
jgi:hypothetical protein